MLQQTKEMSDKMKNGLELRISLEKGKGVFATRYFKPGDAVLVGIIEQALTHNHSHASQIGENEYVFHGGLTSKVNHCCSPNCGIKTNETGAHDLVAMKYIETNEEITFDYAMRNYSIDYFPQKCMCGSDSCRGEITGWKDLSREKKNEYKGFVAPYLLKLDTTREQSPSIKVAREGAAV